MHLRRVQIVCDTFTPGALPLMLFSTALRLQKISAWASGDPA
jgi:hypothetical protein